MELLVVLDLPSMRRKRLLLLLILALPAVAGSGAAHQLRQLSLSGGGESSQESESIELRGMSEALPGGRRRAASAVGGPGGARGGSLNEGAGFSEADQPRKSAGSGRGEGGAATCLGGHAAAAPSRGEPSEKSHDIGGEEGEPDKILENWGTSQIKGDSDPTRASIVVKGKPTDDSDETLACLGRRLVRDEVARCKGSVVRHKV